MSASWHDDAVQKREESIPSINSDSENRRDFIAPLPTGGYGGRWASPVECTVS